METFDPRRGQADQGGAEEGAGETHSRHEAEGTAQWSFHNHCECAGANAAFALHFLLLLNKCTFFIQVPILLLIPVKADGALARLKTLMRNIICPSAY